MSDRSTFSVLTEHLASLFSPLRQAVSDVDSFRVFFLRLGWNVDDVPDEYVALGDKIVSAIAQFQALPDDVGLDDVKSIFDVISDIYNKLSTLPPPPGVGATASQLAESLIELLLADYLARETPQIFRLLCSLGIVTSEYSPETADRPAYLRRNLRWSELPKVLSDPRSIGNRVYGWGDADFNFIALAEDLLEVLSAFGVRAELRKIGTLAERGAFLTDRRVTGRDSNAALDAIVAEAIVNEAPVVFGLSVLALPAEGTKSPGLVVQPLIPTSVQDTIDLGDGVSLIFEGKSNFNNAFGLLVRPGDVSIRQPFGGAVALTGDAKVKLQAKLATPFLLLGRPNASRFEVGGVTAAIEFRASTAGSPEMRFDLSVQGVQLVIKGGDGDGFIDQVMSGRELDVPLEFGLRWSSATGLGFSGGGGFQLTFPLNVSLGPLHVSTLSLGVLGKAGASGAGELALEIGASFDVALGPVDIVVDGIGTHLDVAFEAGNAGPFNIAAGFKFPRGLGITIDGGSVSGGGFVSIDEPNGRYFGALELRVYDINVKAFGLIETKFPDGHKGFSFLIIISAEFTPVQLGFGFTLNGVGGMAGINRTIDTDALLTMIRRGTLEHLLFPQDPVKDAPTIVHDVGALFPPASGHYTFGPMAKLAWIGLVQGEIGLVIEFPGPRLVVLGTVHAELPKPDQALVVIHLDVGGVLDFPKKYFSLDASLHDSRVGEFPLTGDMAMRLTWGNNPNFALAIGGFNPHFNPPNGFPKLRPAAVELGQHDNPSINLAGYVALTSNTAQTGAKLEARISKSGASLYGFIAFDAIFVFSPFSFMADVEGGVDVSFHGHGFNLHFHGHIQGPSPWKLDGQVCVSILFWDACVGFSVTLGGSQTVTLPGLDPWVGSPATERVLAKQDVQGVSQSLETSANWAGGLPPSSFSVVSLIAAPQGAPTPIDPLGSATFRQKAAPLAIDITRFAGTKPSVARNFAVQSVTIGQAGQGMATVPTTIPITAQQLVDDYFAPGQYIDMKDADKLSHPSFDLMKAGFTISTDKIVPGVGVTRAFKYDTVLFSANGPPQQHDRDYDPSNTQVAAMSLRSAAALGGIRRTGLARFTDTPFVSRAILVNDIYGVTNIGNLGAAAGFAVGTSKSTAFAALLAAAATNPSLKKTLQVGPTFTFRPGS